MPADNAVDRTEGAAAVEIFETALVARCDAERQPRERSCFVNMRARRGDTETNE
jgi:hypothetical protein